MLMLAVLTIGGKCGHEDGDGGACIAGCGCEWSDGGDVGGGDHGHDRDVGRDSFLLFFSQQRDSSYMDMLRGSSLEPLASNSHSRTSWKKPPCDAAAATKAALDETLASNIAEALNVPLLLFFCNLLCFGGGLGCQP